MEIFVILGAITAYFFPAVIAINRKHQNRSAIFATNLLFGWTGLGWGTALIWSLTNNTKVEK